MIFSEENTNVIAQMRSRAPRVFLRRSYTTIDAPGGSNRIVTIGIPPPFLAYAAWHLGHRRA